MSDTLRSLVHEREFLAMIGIAAFLRSSPETPERGQEAAYQVRMAMYRSAIGQISGAERDGILASLQPCCRELFPQM